jgi:ribosome-associated heat shock protein Hsp15
MARNLQNRNRLNPDRGAVPTETGAADDDSGPPPGSETSPGLKSSPGLKLSSGPKPSATIGSQRLDKWLWHARVVKTRTAAAGLVSEGKVRVGAVRVEKPAHAVKRGDVVSVVLRGGVRLLEVAGFTERRGSPELAATSYVDLAPPKPKPADPAATDASDIDAGRRDPGSGRPTKRDRRRIDRLQGN